MQEPLKMGHLRVVRGSSNKKGAVTSTLQMIERLKEGESVAIMVDGPSRNLCTKLKME